MKPPLIIQNAKMDSWHLIDWLETSSQSVLCEIHRTRGGASPPHLPWWSARSFEWRGSYVAEVEWFHWSHLSSVIPFQAQSMFMIKLYIWVSTTKWTGRQERRSWVAGSHVSQERALYCSRTNLWYREKVAALITKVQTVWHMSSF